MRFLANENIPRPSIRRLREAGHDVAAVIEDSRGAKDREILERAARDSWVVLTFDRDYGELIYRIGLPAPAGLVHFRFDPASPEEPAERLIAVLSTPGLTLEGYYSIIKRGQVRQRALP